MSRAIDDLERMFSLPRGGLLDDAGNHEAVDFDDIDEVFSAPKQAPSAGAWVLDTVAEWSSRVLAGNYFTHGDVMKARSGIRDACECEQPGKFQAREDDPRWIALRTVDFTDYDKLGAITADGLAAAVKSLIGLDQQVVVDVFGMQRVQAILDGIDADARRIVAFGETPSRRPGLLARLLGVST